MNILRIILSLTLSVILASAAFSSSDLYGIKQPNLQNESISFDAFRGKVLLIVNTASMCGFTSQLRDMQKVHDQFSGDGLVVLGFPSNDFKQEHLSATQLAQFCERNYGVKFTMFQKSHVNGPKRNPVFKYLINHSTNQRDVQWNFEKFLVNRQGEVVGRFSSGVSPSDKKLQDKIKEALASKRQQ